MGTFRCVVAWVSSPPTHLQTINILDSSEFYVNFQHFFCDEPSMLIVCGWVGGAVFALHGVVFGPPTHLHNVSSFVFFEKILVLMSVQGGPGGRTPRKNTCETVLQTLYRTLGSPNTSCFTTFLGSWCTVAAPGVTQNLVFYNISCPFCTCCCTPPGHFSSPLA